MNSSGFVGFSYFSFLIVADTSVGCFSNAESITITSLMETVAVDLLTLNKNLKTVSKLHL